MVGQVFYINSDKYHVIAEDIQQVKNRVDKKHDEGFECVFEALPPVRRTLSIPEKLQNGDTATALGMASLALINLPEDLRDIKGAYNQLKGAKPNYDYKNYQHSFSFFKGTMIEKWLYKQVCAGKKWAQWLYRNDKTLSDTKFGEKILKGIGAKENDICKTSIKRINGNSVYAFSYAGSPFAQLTGKVFKRTTIFGIGAITLLELPKIFKSDEKVKQTIKSAINIASVTTGIGYGGAIGAKYGGALGSLIGMGAGAVLGSKLSENVQEII